MPPSASGPGTLQAQYVRDAMGRIASQSEYNSAGTAVVYSKSASYDKSSNVLTDQISTVRSDGSGTYVQSDTYGYNAAVYNASTGTYSYTGPYMGGAVTHIATSLTKNGTAQPSSDTRNTYAWYEYAAGQQETLIETREDYRPNTAQSTVYDTVYNYDTNHRGLTSASINDGTPRTVGYTENLAGEVASSVNSKGPQSRYVFFEGRELAEISNDGTDNITFTQSIARQTATPGAGYFVNGSTTPTNAASFGTQYEAINGLGNETEAAARSYAVQAGDTLSSIAQAVWGDASFWYLIAQANGLAGNEMLEAGQVLLIPNKVANASNNASTFAVYDPNKAIGDTSPTHPPRPHHHHGCGIFGQIILAVVAIAVTVLLRVPVTNLIAFGSTVAPAGVTAGIGATIAGGAIAGAAGSIASQGVGLATGIQSKFSFAQVATSALSAGVDGGVGASGVFNGIGSDFLRGFVTGAVSSALTQGIAVATGLQSKFDFVGVAAAGVTQGVAGYVGAQLKDVRFGGDEILNGAARNFVSGMAGAIAGAAARSLIAGTDFGDNLIANLPNAIAATVGNAIAEEIEQAQQPDDLLAQIQSKAAARAAADIQQLADTPIVPTPFDPNDLILTPPMVDVADDAAFSGVQVASNGSLNGILSSAASQSSGQNSNPIETVVVTAKRLPLSSYPAIVQQILRAPKTTKWTVTAHFKIPAQVLGYDAVPRTAVHTGFNIYKDGKLFASIDAGPNFAPNSKSLLGNLIFDNKDIAQSSSSLFGPSELPLSPPPSVDTATFAANLITAAYSYDNSLPYDFPPEFDVGVVADVMSPNKYNSNSFAAAVLDLVGAASDVNLIQNYLAKQNYAAPGLEQPVPLNHFH